MADFEDNFATARQRLPAATPQRVAPTVPETGALHFPAGTVFTTRPTKEQLQDSAAAWLAMARNQLGSIEYWAEQGDRVRETLESLKVLRSHLTHLESAIRESEHAK